MTDLCVVVPSLGRPDALARCLAALAQQSRAPDQVLVVSSADDDATADVVRSADGVALVTVAAPGVLAAMAAGVRATSATVVAFTDDDAVAPPEWTGRLLDAIGASSRVGGAGGRDVVHLPDGTVEPGALVEDVGRLTWYGRHVGGHHLGHGGPRDVAFLKGVNAAYRRSALAIPTGLRGGGAQVHFEVAIGRFARSHGYRLVYDPATTVAHHPALRLGDDQRGAPSADAVADAAYNLVVAIGGARGLVRVAYATLVGDRGAPGLARAVVALVRGDRATAGKLGASVRGTLAGGWALVRGRGVAYETFA